MWGSLLTKQDAKKNERESIAGPVRAIFVHVETLASTVYEIETNRVVNVSLDALVRTGRKIPTKISIYMYIVRP